MQAKLTQLATQIGYAGNQFLIRSFSYRSLTNVSFSLGTVIAILTVLVLIIRFSVENYAMKNKKFEVDDIHEWVSFVIIGITVLVIAVPEGLPLAVTLALAYSVKVSQH